MHAGFGSEIVAQIQGPKYLNAKNKRFFLNDALFSANMPVLY